MIEDIELTRKILELFASDDVGFPANLRVQTDLEENFPDIPLETLQYHIICAFECGLLHGSYDRNVMHDGIIYTIDFIDGLTASGGEYIRQSRSSHLDTAKKLIQNAGAQITTSLLIEALNHTVRKAVGLS